MASAIELRGVSKSFRGRASQGGLSGALRSLLRARYYEVHAVEELSFQIEAGERVAFVGPNGAGKSTTIKMLSGVLYPTRGEIEVLGLVPWRDRRALGYEIGTVFGQRSRLWLHLPAGDTFDLLAQVYDLDGGAYRRRRDELIDAFGIGGLVAKPVRHLSLGERMRCELVASLLHRPSILFLDEPTIGLDVVAKATLRDLVRELSERDGSTVLLASHDTGDMERVCDRVLVIHGGRLLLDRGLDELRRTFIRRKVVTLLSADERIEVEMAGVAVVSRLPHRVVLEVDTERTKIEAVVQAVLSTSRLQDISVEDPPMEEIVQAIYTRAGALAGTGAGVVAAGGAP